MRSDTAWNDVMHEVNAMLEGWFQSALDPEKKGIGLALRHGLRMIGAAIMVPDPARANHLSPGPCVLMEYHNRGPGTALLGESLRQLREAGFFRAATFTKSNAPVAKFLLSEIQRRPYPWGHAAPCGLSNLRWAGA